MSPWQRQPDGAQFLCSSSRSCLIVLCIQLSLKFLQQLRAKTIRTHFHHRLYPSSVVTIPNFAKMANGPIMICKTGLKNMVLPIAYFIYDQGVYGTVFDATKAFDIIDCKLFRDDKRKTPHFWYHKKKNRDSYQLYRDTNRVTSIAIHRCIDESCRH